MIRAEVRNLCKSFGKHKVLKNVSFSIQDHEIVGFIGPNGAGKSTTMKCMASLIYPTSGQIIIEGHDLAKERELALQYVSAMIEAPGLFPTLSGYENLQYFARLKHVDQKRIEEIATFTRLHKSLDKRAGQYSMGMKQRLGLGIAMLGHPKFLILDEPTNGLDPQGICDMRDLLKRLQEERGMSILISSHMLAELDKVATDFVVIRSGKIIEQFTKEELLERCRDCFQLRVDDVKKASVILEETCFVQTYEVLPKGILRLYDHYEDPSHIARQLVLHDVALYGMEDHHQDLEAYFLKEGEEHVE